jgi:UDP-glucuronate decarboxylase
MAFNAVSRRELASTMLDMIIDRNVDKNFFSKSFIVTGGAGFLGSWLCEAICHLGGRVVCIDNLSTGLHTNIDGLMQHKNFRLVRQSITEADLSSIKADFVFHMASRPSPDDYFQHPVESLLPNSVGSERLLEYCRKNGVPMAFASTSETYGDAKIIPTPETYWGNVNPVGLRSCYDEGKRYAEALCMAYSRQYKTDVRIFRIFNTYGPRLRADGSYGRALSRFLMQASESKDITIFGDGNQTRSFCFVSDTVRAIMYLAQAAEVRDVINIGNPNEITMNELASIIIKTLGSASSIVHLPPAPDDPRRRCPDITRAQKVLGWSPTIELSEGLKRTIEWNNSE